MLYQLERDEMMIIYGDVHRVGEKKVKELLQQVSGNVEENHSILQTGWYVLKLSKCKNSS